MRQLFWIFAALLFLGNTSPGTATERPLSPTSALAETLRERPAAASAFRHLRKTAAARGQIRVIVGLRGGYVSEGALPAPAAASQRRAIASHRQAVLNRLPAHASRNARSFDALPLVAMNVSAAELDALAADPNVATVMEDQELTLQLAESVPLIQGDVAWASGYRGLGQTIAIIDSGVDKAHPFLFGKVVSEACYSTGRLCPGGVTSSTAPGSARPCTNAACTHGTHVAGIAAGNGWNFSGVAKDATIIAIQVMSPNGKSISAYTSDMIAALLRVYELRNSFRIASVNMSLGSQAVFAGNCDTLDSGFENPMKTAIDLLRTAGIATVIASGNSYASDGISSPACISTAVSVGAVSDAAWGKCAGADTAVDKVTCYSNSSDALSLLAPGSLIVSSVPNRKYAAEHGTSMAAPHVAGAWAVLKEKSPNAGVGAVYNALAYTGKPVTDDRNGLTKPRINVAAALGQFTDSRHAIAYVQTGSAQGQASFSPAGSVASCRQDCFNRFAPGTTVTLTATPDSGARFYGWGGDCSGTGPCTLTMSRARSVSAAFYSGSLVALSYSQSGTGRGGVSFSMPGFTATCSANCVQSYWKNATVTLAAEPASGSSFAGWTGVCAGQKQFCTVRISSAKSVGAVFNTLPLSTVTYSSQGSGRGTVSFGVGGAAPCTENCSRTLPAGTAIALTASPQAGSEFVGWSGTCRGPKQTCTLTLNGSISVSAEFRALASAQASRY